MSQDQNVSQEEMQMLIERLEVIVQMCLDGGLRQCTIIFIVFKILSRPMLTLA
jgi:phosphate starvation-inducible protein PhoH